MGWKEWPYWLKGGIISLIYIVYALLIQFLIFNKLSNNVLNGNWIFIPLGILQLPLIGASIILFLNSSPEQLSITSIIPLFIGSIILILLGIFIGWIVGKIKNK